MDMRCEAQNETASQSDMACHTSEADHDESARGSGVTVINLLESLLLVPPEGSSTSKGCTQLKTLGSSIIPSFRRAAADYAWSAAKIVCHSQTKQSSASHLQKAATCSLPLTIQQEQPLAVNVPLRSA
jgi:hypothetical protein